MVRGSFSLLIPNLLIGLSKGSRFLQPYADRFTKLGYKLFKLEGSYTTEVGKLNPDLIMYSYKLGNTLIFEWTEKPEVDNQKEKQLCKYAQITADDIRTIVAVPVGAVNSYNITLIVSEQGVEAYNVYLGQQAFSFPLMVLKVGVDGCELRKSTNDFIEQNTDRFFADGLVVDRIPRRYLQFPLDKGLAMDCIAPFVVRHLMSLIVKEETEFTIEKFCQGYIPIWNYIGSEKQKEIRNCTRAVLGELIKTSVGKKLLQRIEQPRSWRIIGNEYFKERQRSVRSALNNFINEMTNKVSTPIPLFDD